MTGPLFREIATKNHLTTASGMAYGLLGGCFVTLWEDAAVQRISIYVGAQEQPLPGYDESRTVSCARQICHTISAASGPENVYALMTGNEAVPALVLNHAGSVVTVNFPATPEARSGIERFIAEVLPQIAPLTRPQHCILCCGETGGEAVPVRLSADTVVPMHAACHQQLARQNAPSTQEQNRQKRAALLSALGALIGAVVWALLCGFGPVAWGAAVLMGLLPTLAYDLMKGNPGRERLVTVVTCAAIAAALGSLGGWLFTAFNTWKSEIVLMNANDIGYWAYAWAALVSPVTGVLAALLRSLIAGLIFAGIGCIGCFRKSAADPTPSALADSPRRLRGRF